MVVNTWLIYQARAGRLGQCHEIQSRSQTAWWRVDAKKLPLVCQVSLMVRSPHFASPISFDGRRSVYARRPRRPPGARALAGGRSDRPLVASLRRVPSTGSVRPPRSAGRRHRRWSGHRRNAGQRSRPAWTLSAGNSYGCLAGSISYRCRTRPHARRDKPGSGACRKFHPRVHLPRPIGHPDTSNSIA